MIDKQAKTKITSMVNNLGFTNWGCAKLKSPLSIDLYKSWLNNNYHGEMNYLKDHLPLKENPKTFAPFAKSIIVVSKDYFTASAKLGHFKIARYARHKDYHIWFKELLDKLALELCQQFPDTEFITCTDSSPVLERDWAYQSGLGWFGKNTCTLSRHHGSFFFLGQILTSLEVKESASLPTDHCGTCTRCLDACPTDAFNEERVLDAKKCISYWTIESKKVPPVEIRKKMGDWFFGCDVCQEVCPWNIKLHPELKNTEPTNLAQLEDELRLILTTSNKKLMKTYADTPLSRAGGRGLKRNALIVAANSKLTGLIPEISPYLKHESLGDLCHWTLSQLDASFSADK